MALWTNTEWPCVLIDGNALNRELGQVWAPDLQKVDGKYYIYFPSSFQFYVVYADSMEGPWSEPIDLGRHTLIEPVTWTKDGWPVI